MIAYVDSSVILRLVLGQPSRLREWKRIATGIVSTLVEVECLRTLDRWRLREQVSPHELSLRRAAVSEFLNEMQEVGATKAVFSRASQPMPTPLGTLDAIHLASALLWREHNEASDMVFATHDETLALAARASGLQTIGT